MSHSPNAARPTPPAAPGQPHRRPLPRPGRRLRLGLGLAATVGCAGAALLAGPAAAARTTFSTAGCAATEPGNVYTVPDGVSRVRVVAQGSAGGSEATPVPGGTGDVVGGVLRGLTPGQRFSVCVNAGRSVGARVAGGGASGLAVGEDFSTPVLIAAGGGGAANTRGGNAGLPAGAGGQDGFFTAGGGGTQTAPGTAGSGEIPGIAGTGPSAAGPGTGGGGPGGGGGGGWYGGGGGSGYFNYQFNSVIAAGGGGGSDFCASTLPGGLSLDGCAVVGRNGGGGAFVRISDDFTAPEITIIAPEDGATVARGADVAAAYACADGPGGSGVATCAGPVPDGERVDTSTLGAREFTVTSTDEDGNASTKTVSYTVEDRTPPATTIDAGPSGPTNDATPTFAFSADEDGSSFECRVDDETFTPCESPWTTEALRDGDHAFQVRAVDAAGNADPTPATRQLRVDTTPPQTTITAGPGGLSPSSTARFGFSSDDPDASFECRLDGEAFGPCTSPTTRTAGLGGHTFSVRATDVAGNPDPTPATRTWLSLGLPLG